MHYGGEDVGDRACPPHHGFAETYYGLAGKQQGRLNYLRHSAAAVDEYGPEPSWRMGVQPMLDGDTEVELEGFLTDELGSRARDFVARHADEPFLCMVAFNAVHNFCWQLPPDELAKRELPERDDWRGDTTEDYLDWYDGSIAPNLEHGREYYLAQLELMDAQIGHLLDDLDQLGLAEDTIVVWPPPARTPRRTPTATVSTSCRCCAATTPKATKRCTGTRGSSGQYALDGGSWHLVERHARWRADVFGAP